MTQAYTITAQRIAPMRAVVLLMLLTAVAWAGAVLYVCDQPYIGIETTPRAGGVVVQHVADGGPAAGRLKPGDILVAIRVREQELRLSANDAFAEIDLAADTLAELRVFRQRQGRLLAALSGPDSHWLTADGREVLINAMPQRGVQTLNLNFWFHGLVALFGIAISAGVWAYRQQDWAARGFLAMGVGLAVAAAAAGVYTSRELALGTDALRFLGALNQIGTQLYSGGYVVAMLRYPQTLGSAVQCRWILAGFMTWSLLIGVWQPFQGMSTDLAFRVPILLALVWALALAGRQWIASRERPLARAALLWYCFAWFVGGVAFVALQVLPALIGATPSETQVFGFGFLLLTNVGIALGVIRYRLFDLGQWWMHAWGMVLGGVMVILADAAMLSVLRLDTELSLALSLAIVGWAYFPVRQWVWQRVTRNPVERDERALLSEVLRASSDNAQQGWQRLMHNIFKPLEIVPAGGHRAEPAVIDGGAALYVPGPEYGLTLRWLARGRRLAGSRDVQLAERLHSLYARISLYREAVAEGAQRERQRIAQDLHDDVGARLLSVRQRVDASTAEDVTEILADIRTIVHSLAGPHASLTECLADCRNELADRCEQAGVDWQWPLDTDLPAVEVPPDWNLDLVRILRELTNNALKHAAPTYMHVRISSLGNTLTFALRHDATRVIDEPDRWRANLGLRNLQRRCRAQGGHIRWRLDPESGEIEFTGCLGLPPNTGSAAPMERAQWLPSNEAAREHA